jgi:(E)-4-hydroxy-3-methylbut-2-enyl-diphosphate synthase
MIKRRKTKTVRIGPLRMGYRSPILLQTMTKVPTTNIRACVRQIDKLTQAGCDLVRIAVPTRKDTEAFARIVEKVDMPLAADIHFSANRAIEAIEAGAAKIRLNPGNIKQKADILRIIHAAKMHGVAVRVGVNEASIRDLGAKEVPAARRVGLMLREMKKYVRTFEKTGFENIVLSAKSADTVRTIEINRAIAQAFDYPIHIGLTHAGLEEDARIPSAVTIGTLLAEGIGDTIRVSIGGDPVREIYMGRQILQSLGLCQRRTPELVVCPTCGRCKIDVVRLAKKTKKILKDIDKPIRVAVMGCVVNGPGESADADVAICAAQGKGYIYSHGKKIAVVPEEKLLDRLVAEIKKL